MLLCDIQKAMEWNYEEMFAATKESLNHCQCLCIWAMSDIYSSPLQANVSLTLLKGLALPFLLVLGQELIATLQSADRKKHQI